MGDQSLTPDAAPPRAADVVTDSAGRSWEPDDRIVSIDLDERRILRRAANIEHERAVAVHDLLQGNRFRILGDKPNVPKPYRLLLGIEEPMTLVFWLRSESDDTPLDAFTETSHLPVEKIPVAIKQFRRIVKDYFEICESYFDAIKRLPAAQIQAIDMARRGVHDEGAEQLQYTLRNVVQIDRNTARRLFALICVLHLR